MSNTTKDKPAKVTTLLPRDAVEMVCDRCDREYLAYPTNAVRPPGAEDDGCHLTAVSVNPDSDFCNAIGGEHGGIPDGDLCASCMTSFIYWWVSARWVKGRADRERRDYLNGQSHPDIDEIECTINYPLTPDEEL
jgi:hypothetical protein